MDEQLREFNEILSRQNDFLGDVTYSKASKILYSTDASIYQIEPLGVAFPKIQEDIGVLVQAANKVGLPITARGSGSSLAGQAIGASLIIDCSRYLNRIVNLNIDKREVIVEPGVILTDLNKYISRNNLMFGPDPASADRATIGGCIANNATGAHSIVYGMTADHLLEVDATLADGSKSQFKQITLSELDSISREGGRLSSIASVIKNIRENYVSEIKEKWPNTWRRVSGYNINYLLPWSSSQPPLWSDASKDWDIGNKISFSYPPVEPNTVNLAHLLAGSEGTLAIINSAKLRLVPKPLYSALVVKSYSSLLEACDVVPDLLSINPTAIELIPQSLIRLARSVPAYSHLLAFVNELTENGTDPAALLVLEFSDSDPQELQSKIKRFRSNSYIAETALEQKNVWAVRKVGLGILMSRPGDRKPVAFIEDMAVPVNKLGDFVREMEDILFEHDTQADYYAHASAGCLHIRPILNLKSELGVKNLRSISQKAVLLTLKLQGAISAEHGDGLARSEWITLAYGQKINQVFHDLKQAADPKNLLNPGKITNPNQMDTNLRYGQGYETNTWVPVFNLDKLESDQKIGLTNAIEQCNGAGVCRKSEGVMCPSFQASQDEMHSTRGRANLLRALISGQLPNSLESLQIVKESLDLCLACKGCKSECPSGVDVAKLKYEFSEYYYKQPKVSSRPLRDYLFGNIHFFSKLGYPFRMIVNFIFQKALSKKFADRTLGISRNRQLPLFSKNSLQKTWEGIERIHSPQKGEKVLFLSDAFTEYFQVEAGISALKLLESAGCEVEIIPILGAGRTLISKGFLSEAKKHAVKVLDTIQQLDPLGICSIVSIEPSEIYTLRDEYLDLFPDNQQLDSIRKRSWMIDEFLIRPASDGITRLEKIVPSKVIDEKIILHGHCYQKAQPPAEDGYPTGVTATQNFLKYFGVDAQLVDAGCCGMAGAFGYEKEHYQFSQKVGELFLFPAIRKVESIEPKVIVAVSGVSCHTQIEDGIGTKTLHPVQIAEQCIGNTR